MEAWKMADLRNFLDKAYDGKGFAELAESPVDALQGLSQTDAAALERRSVSRLCAIWRPTNSSQRQWASPSSARIKPSNAGLTAGDCSIRLMKSAA
jgi:hypothetical protein